MARVNSKYEVTDDYSLLQDDDEPYGLFGPGVSRFLTYDMWGIPSKERESRTVMSLTDYLLHNVFSDERTRKLSESDAANQRMNLLTYRITSMTSAAICYAPLKATDGQYEMPTIDIQEMTSIGVAMAMLILSVMQNEIMLDTQMEAVKGTQNQKLSASQTKMLQIQQQIRKSRYQSPFQKFMKKLSDSCVMKFLNSNYGKAIMFAIGAAVTIASFGSAGPAVIAISCVLLSFQAAELVLGKSMGELITSGMDDGSAKMALQMSIDIGLMVASIAAGGGGGGSDGAEAATKAAETLGKVASAVQKVQKAVQAVMTLIQALDNFAMSQEQITKMRCTAEMEMIETLAQAEQDFLQMLIDNQMADMQSLLAYTKASFARAAEVIREYGDTSQMIARNLVA
ncbi:MAG: hypothetical protein LBF34_01705 [Puniceicoccales bacterium]|jgi:vacuolar-type H+-ATPase subunit H|nr:hypothetical protein [Puniceicoccales bacterium]